MLGSAEEFGADTDIQETQNHTQVKTRYWAPLQLQIAERAIFEIVVGRRLYAASRKLLHGTWNLRHNTLHRFARLAGS